MNKSDKQFEKQIISALTHVCEAAKDEFKGFVWLTHQIKFASPGKSFLLVCVFETNHMQRQAETQGAQRFFANQTALAFEQSLSAKFFVQMKSQMKVKTLMHQIVLDNEEACLATHQGDWAKRLSLRH